MRVRQVSTVSDLATLEEDIVHEHEGWVALTRDDWASLARAPALENARTAVVAERGYTLVVRFQRDARGQ